MSEAITIPGLPAPRGRYPHVKLAGGMAFVSGTSSWSQHAYGRAIDINPVENPYVGPWGVSPPNGKRFVHRKPVRRGMLSFHDRGWRAFHAIGWHWGGSWNWPTDYQHYSATNR